MGKKNNGGNSAAEDVLVTLGYKYYQCPHCGKQFYIANVPDYVYKRGTRKFCSWSCMRASDRGESPKVSQPQE